MLNSLLTGFGARETKEQVEPVSPELPKEIIKNKT